MTDDTPQSLIEHLRELRTRLIRCLLALTLALLALAPFAAKLYSLLALPLLELLPADGALIATEVASPFLAPFKLILALAAFITAPYWLHQAWSFAAPGLYQNEKRFSAGLLISSVTLFYLGAVFAGLVVLPLVLNFFIRVAPADIVVMTDISHYLGFTLKMFLAFGVAFEIPIAVWLAIRTGLASVEGCRRARAYVVVGCFVVGMLLTPPDVISQIMLALPAWLLYEVGILAGRYL